MALEVVHYWGGQAGAPASGAMATIGRMIALLDAYLVNGFNSISVTGITQVSGLATVVTASPHNFSINDVVNIDGAGQANYNGNQRVLGIPNSTSFTFAVSSGTVTPATGTITAKHPPAGWTKPFSGTNQAIYRNNSTTGTGIYLQVDDTNASHTYLKMIKNCTGFNSGDIVGIQLTWYKEGTNAWVFAGDSRTFYLMQNTWSFSVAGDIKKYRSDDQHNFVCSTHLTNSSQNSNYIVWSRDSMHAGQDSGDSIRGNTYALTSINQISKDEPLMRLTTGVYAYLHESQNLGVFFGASTAVVYAPNLADGRFHFGRAIFYERQGLGTNCLRGEWRGVVFNTLGQFLASGFLNGFQIRDLTVAGQNRKFLFISSQAANHIIDITDTWA
jgi:hypothetical protein